MRNIAPFLILAFVVAVAAAYFFWINQDNSNNEADNPPPVSQGQEKIGLTLIASDLGSPTAIVSTTDESDGRLFVVDRGGIIRIIDEDKEVLDQPFLDISSKVLAGGEMGLLGLAFHPDFSSNGEFFVNYVDKDRTTTISRLKTSQDQNVADAESEEILLTVPQPYSNHNGGDLAFGPDGFLYIALGDGGSAGDPENRAQNLNLILGKLLRIDVDGGDPYSIPSDNPFVGRANVKEEIWAYGLRNPWRISFDKETNDLWIADVGQGKVEEIDFEEAGGKGGINYGWRCYEGNSKFKVGGCGEKTNYTFPILEYRHTNGRCSVTGGYVYRGEKNQSIKGGYIYGDYCTGEVFIGQETEDRWESKVALDTAYKISTFGQGSDGEIYLADLATGSIYQIQTE